MDVCRRFVYILDDRSNAKTMNTPTIDRGILMMFHSFLEFFAHFLIIHCVEIRARAIPVQIIMQ